MSQLKLERYELWRSPDGGSDSFLAASSWAEALEHGSIEPGSQLIWTTEAASWDEAQQKRYDFMDWGHYRTMEEDEAEFKETSSRVCERVTPLKSKPRGVGRKCRNMVRDIESCTDELPLSEERYWHFHLPVDRKFIDSTATPMSVRRLCVQTLIDQALRLARNCSVPSRVVVAVILPKLSDSQIIRFWSEDYFQNFFERDSEDQMWIPIREESLARLWNLRLPDNFRERGYTEIMRDGKDVPHEQIWFLGQI